MYHQFPLGNIRLPLETHDKNEIEKSIGAFSTALMGAEVRRGVGGVCRTGGALTRVRMQTFRSFAFTRGFEPKHRLIFPIIHTALAREADPTHALCMDTAQSGAILHRMLTLSTGSEYKPASVQQAFHTVVTTILNELAEFDWMFGRHHFDGVCDLTQLGSKVMSAAPLLVVTAESIEPLERGETVCIGNQPYELRAVVEDNVLGMAACCQATKQWWIYDDTGRKVRPSPTLEWPASGRVILAVLEKASKHDVSATTSTSHWSPALQKAAGLPQISGKLHFTTGVTINAVCAQTGMHTFVHQRDLRFETEGSSLGAKSFNGVPEVIAEVKRMEALHSISVLLGGKPCTPAAVLALKGLPIHALSIRLRPTDTIEYKKELFEAISAVFDEMSDDQLKMVTKIRLDVQLPEGGQLSDCVDQSTWAALTAAGKMLSSFRKCVNLTDLRLWKFGFRFHDVATAAESAFKNLQRLSCFELSNSLLRGDTLRILFGGSQFPKRLHTLGVCNVDLKSLAGMVDFCQWVTASRESLVRLKLCKCKVTMRETGLVDAMKKCTRMQTLNLFNNTIGDEGATQLAAVLTKMPLLVDLNVFNNEMMVSGGSVIARALREARCLSLFKSNVLARSGCDELSQTLRNTCLALTHLFIPTNRVANEGMTLLASDLARCNNLRVLDLQDNRLDDDSMVLLATTLPSMPRLTKLSLHRNPQVTPTGGAAIAAQCGKLVKLTHFTSPALGTAGCNHLATSLPKMTSLLSLSLCASQIGAEGMSRLRPALSAHTILRHLNIQKNDLRNEGVRELGRSIAGMTRLTDLRVGENDADAEAYEGVLDAAMRNPELMALCIHEARALTADQKSAFCWKLTTLMQRVRSLMVLYVSDDLKRDCGALGREINKRTFGSGEGAPSCSDLLLNVNDSLTLLHVRAPEVVMRTESVLLRLPPWQGAAMRIHWKRRAQDWDAESRCVDIAPDQVGDGGCIWIDGLPREPLSFAAQVREHGGAWGVVGAATAFEGASNAPPAELRAVHAAPQGGEQTQAEAWKKRSERLHRVDVSLLGPSDPTPPADHAHVSSLKRMRDAFNREARDLHDVRAQLESAAKSALALESQCDRVAVEYGTALRKREDAVRALQRASQQLEKKREELEAVKPQLDAAHKNKRALEEECDRVERRVRPRLNLHQPSLSAAQNTCLRLDSLLRTQRIGALTTDDVLELLGVMDLGHHVQRFSDNRIDGQSLLGIASLDPHACARHLGVSVPEAQRLIAVVTEVMRADGSRSAMSLIASATPVPCAKESEWTLDAQRAWMETNGMQTLFGYFQERGIVGGVFESFTASQFMQQVVSDPASGIGSTEGLKLCRCFPPTTAAKGAGASITEQSVPQEFICPINMTVMEDPVQCSDGWVYERAAIQKWMSQSAAPKSPMTNQSLTSQVLFPNTPLKNRINEWHENQKKKQQQQQQ